MKRYFILVLSIFFLFISADVLLAKKGTLNEKAGEHLKMYSKPNKQSDVVHKLKKGNIFKILSTNENNWHKIKFKTYKGWVNGKFVESVKNNGGNDDDDDDGDDNDEFGDDGNLNGNVGGNLGGNNNNGNAANINNNVAAGANAIDGNGDDNVDGNMLGMAGDGNAIPQQQIANPDDNWQNEDTGLGGDNGANIGAGNDQNQIGGIANGINGLDQLGGMGNGNGGGEGATLTMNGNTMMLNDEAMNLLMNTDANYVAFIAGGCSMSLTKIHNLLGFKKGETFVSKFGLEKCMQMAGVDKPEDLPADFTTPATGEVDNSPTTFELLGEFNTEEEMNAAADRWANQKAAQENNNGE